MLFLLQSYCFFRYFQTFFNFFSFLACRSYNNSKFCFACVPPFSGGACSVGAFVVVVCPEAYFHTYAHTYAHTHARARGFLDSNF